MTKITAGDIKYLAQLNKLKLDDEQVDSLTADMNEILGYVELLDEVDTDGLEATAQVTGLTNITRQDELIDYGVSKTKLLQNVVDQTDGYIKVPKVLG